MTGSILPSSLLHKKNWYISSMWAERLGTRHSNSLRILVIAKRDHFNFTCVAKYLLTEFSCYSHHLNKGNLKEKTENSWSSDTPIWSLADKNNNHIISSSASLHTGYPGPMLPYCQNIFLNTQHHWIIMLWLVSLKFTRDLLISTYFQLKILVRNCMDLIS